MLRRSSVPRPRLLKLAVPGGRFVNALVFPTGLSDPAAATVTSAKSVWPGLPDAAPQPPNELVERALAAAIADEPDAPQDFDAREVRILVQPLRDLRRVLRRGRRAPGTAKSGRRHLTRAIHGMTP